MGTQNRQRRRAKQKKQSARRVSGPGQRPAHDAGEGANVYEDRPVDVAFIESVILTAVNAHADGDDLTLAHLLDMLEDGPPSADGRAVVDAAVLRVLEREVSGAWLRGWQPADIPRAARRLVGPRAEPMIVDAIASESTQYAAATIDPAWADQLDAIDARVWWKSTASYVDQRGAASRMSRRDTLTLAVEVLTVFCMMPTLPRLCPLPGEAVAATAPRRPSPGVDGRLLERVRALLAKAESTTFPEEAEALSAKAQELMARYSIDQAMLDSAAGASSGDVVGRRLGVDDPYASAKAVLLGHVARANRCQAVWSSGLGFSTVFGSRHDLAGVELLFTSLLRQATTAMLEHGKDYRRARGARFRRSFLLGYATRIGTRLRERTDYATSEAVEEHGDVLLPVLAARESAVDDAMQEAFPDTEALDYTVRDGVGWSAGVAAADLASLGVSAEIEESVPH